MKSFFKTLGAAVLGGAIALASYTYLNPSSADDSTNQAMTTSIPEPVAQATSVNYTTNGNEVPNVDFTAAAERSVDAVVHVMNKTVAPARVSPLDLYFGGAPTYREAIGTGSGVIITPDGYIITNNHVIDNSNELQVTLNNNVTYKATLVGADKESDIALIKVETDEELPFIPFADSNTAKIGEWVLAVGNPIGLTSTVTAGIISAKGRDLNKADSQVQSFIQTDAAVNPGNSGGALVNTRGELIGINTAIYSKTGSYIGYSFAVPSNNARKIINDFMEYGFVQKGMLGIRGTDLTGNLATELNVTTTQGIYVSEIVEDSGAAKSDLKKGDVITSLDGFPITKFTELSGYITSKNPGDTVIAEILRNDTTISIPITISKNNTVTIPQLEMKLRNLTDSEKKKYQVTNGVKIEGTLGQLKRYNMSDYVITKVNDLEVKNIDDIQTILREVAPRDVLLIQIKNSEGDVERFRYSVD